MPDVDADRIPDEVRPKVGRRARFVLGGAGAAGLAAVIIVAMLLGDGATGLEPIGDADAAAACGAGSEAAAAELPGLVLDRIEAPAAPDTAGLTVMDCSYHFAGSAEGDDRIALVRVVILYPVEDVEGALETDCRRRETAATAAGADGCRSDVDGKHVAFDSMFGMGTTLVEVFTSFEGEGVSPDAPLRLHEIVGEAVLGRVAGA